MQNETAVLSCKASYDKTKTDIIYSWMFNSHVIDFSGSNSDDARHYSMVIYAILKLHCNVKKWANKLGT